MNVEQRILKDLGDQLDHSFFFKEDEPYEVFKIVFSTQ